MKCPYFFKIFLLELHFLTFSYEKLGFLSYRCNTNLDFALALLLHIVGNAVSSGDQISEAINVFVQSLIFSAQMHVNKSTTRNTTVCGSRAITINPAMQCMNGFSKTNLTNINEEVHYCVFIQEVQILSEENILQPVTPSTCWD